MIDIGVASPRAHGQAMMSTATALTSAYAIRGSGPKVAQAQVAAFRAWEHPDGARFEYLQRITQPCLVVNGVFDNMIPVRNSYMLSEHLPNASR
jgi:pimeloyl-ACP methyl ester carboxylesterase